MKHVILSIILIGLAMGCGPTEPPLYPVQGKVTLDGSPVEKGLIRFAPVNGEAPAGAEIKGGQYSLKVVAGESRVEITAPVVIGKRKAYDTPDSPMIDMIKESIPDKFNTRSELKYKVEPKTNSQDFALKGK
ncbi:MAG: hypothetical protein EBV06_02695 [Planctomycetia bacterium]|nr:hypothetical protein [Planctomycetia bacterium]